MKLSDMPKDMRERAISQLELDSKLYPSGSILGDNARKELNEYYAHNTTKQIVGHAVVGGILAGPAGAIIGGMVGKEKADAKKNRW